MKAAVLAAPNDLVVRREPDPELAPGDILLRVQAATVCGTDIRIYRGRKTAGIRYPSVLGHEFSGTVAVTGGHAGLQVGDRVGVCPFLPCGRCHLCKAGRENLCADAVAVGYEIDGAFAEFIRIPARAVAAGNLRHLPDGMDFGLAALVEPLACVLNGQNQVRLGSGDNVVVLGAGPIGLMHVRLARRRGARQILASDPNPARRAAALASGADLVLDPEGGDMAARVRSATGGRGADVVICAVGVPALAREATDLAAPGGRVSLFAGFTRGEMAAMDVNAIHYRELVVTGAFGLSRRDYDRAFDLLASGQLELGDMITHRLPLEAAGEAFALAESGRAIKVALCGG